MFASNKMSTIPIEEGTGSSEDMGQNAAIIHTRTNSRQRLRISGEQDEQLFPGLPNQITLALITPKLPLQVLVSTLPAASRAWQSVIQSHQVYDARVRSPLFREISCSF
ncbi:unnamed protein product [Calypogeia fissa]